MTAHYKVTLDRDFRLVVNHANDESLSYFGVARRVSIGNSDLSDRNARNRRILPIAHNCRGRTFPGPAPGFHNVAAQNRDRFPDPDLILLDSAGFARGDVRLIVGFTILCFKCGGGVLRRSLGRRAFLAAWLVVARCRRRRLALQSSAGCIFARCRNDGAINYGPVFGRNVIIEHSNLLHRLRACLCLLRVNRACCFLGFNSLRLLIRSGIGKGNRWRTQSQ